MNLRSSSVILSLFLCIGVSSMAIPLQRNLLITVKTTKNFYASRVRNIIDTWFQDAPDDVYFVGDAYDDYLNKEVYGHLIQTKCGSGHTREALSCKMAVEIRLMLEKNARWSCHFDDDSFLNIPALEKFLASLNSAEEWFIGKPSTSEPFRVLIDDLEFATGGAGICLSRGLLRKLEPFLLENDFEEISRNQGFPDDVTLGYILNGKLGIPLTRVSELHSHLEDLTKLKKDRISSQLVLSWPFDDRIPDVGEKHGLL